MSGAMKDIQIDPKEFLEQKKILQDAVDTLRGYSKKYLSDTSDRLGANNYNSDFLSAIRKVLGNMQDTKMPDLTKGLDTYVGNMETVAKGFTALDRDQASTMKTGG